jgi:arabinofuranosyltransferase
VLYVAYVARIGGDFIGFRFLAVPFLASAIVLQRLAAIRLRRAQRAVAAASVAMALGYGVSTPSSPLRVHWDLPAGRGELAHYFPATNLARWRPGTEFPFARFSYVEDAEMCRAMRASEFAVSATGSGGLPGFCYGPRVHLVDRLAITDPLLARQPTASRVRFVPGHLARRLPEGYLESLARGENRIRDPGLAAYYQSLRALTQGPLFTRRRWEEILAHNLTGERRYPGPPQVGWPWAIGAGAKPRD